MDELNYDDLSSLEKELGLPIGSLKNIPIYGRVPAADAIAKVMEMERKSLFRPGLYYIVLTDLMNNTAFNSNYGNAHADIRVQWFHTAAIQSIGEIEISNYITFSKTIGDASLLIFSSIRDVIQWSHRFNENLEAFDQEYSMALYENQLNLPPVLPKLIDKQISDFTLKARRIVHAGEVRYADYNDPLSLAVSQTFKMEKEFCEIELGCTEIVAKTIRPTLLEFGYELKENKKVLIAGEIEATMTYYISPIR
jgi:hypothetical protein